jgi:formylglycine-generating enzyme required for sulfatase activity
MEGILKSHTPVSETRNQRLLLLTELRGRSHKEQIAFEFVIRSDAMSKGMSNFVCLWPVLRDAYFGASSHRCGGAIGCIILSFFSLVLPNAMAQKAETEETRYQELLERNRYYIFERFVKDFPASGHVKEVEKRMARYKKVYYSKDTFLPFSELRKKYEMPEEVTYGTLEENCKTVIDKYGQSMLKGKWYVESLEFDIPHALERGLIIRGGIRIPKGATMVYQFQKNRESATENAGGVVVSIPDSMVRVEGGTFDMGGESSSSHGDPNPTHAVSVSSFYIDQHEVTIFSFKRFVDATKYKTDAEKRGYVYVGLANQPIKRWKVNWRYTANCQLAKGSELNHPVLFVSWNDAVAYARWAGKRLPTSAEWEYAARGGARSNGTKFSGSNGLDQVAWNDPESYATREVMSLKCNELGIYDMSGNVEEWCSDWSSDDFDWSAPTVNPKGPLKGKLKVVRGGSWSSGGGNCAVYCPGWNYPDSGKNDTGFRCVRDVK